MQKWSFAVVIFYEHAPFQDKKISWQRINAEKTKNTSIFLLLFEE